MILIPQFDFQTILNRLSEYMGNSAPDWPAREDLEVIAYWNENFDRQQAISIPLDIYQTFQSVFGTALRFKFSLGGRDFLDLSQPITQIDLDQFKVNTQYAVTLIFDFQIDKGALLEAHWPKLAHSTRAFLAIFPGIAERVITKGDLTFLEEKLWNDEPEQKVTLLIPERSIFLNGSYLAVVGGENLAKLDSIIPANSIDPQITRDLYERCRNSVNWQTNFVKHLTPAQLDFKVDAGEDDPITRALFIHRINAILLYIADRSVIRNKTWISIFISTEQSIEIQLIDPGTITKDQLIPGAANLFGIFEWNYDSRWKVTDRIPLVQLGIIQALNSSDSASRYHLLIENSKTIYENLQWHWKAFIEGKVDEYIHLEQDLEEFVSSSVQSFSDQTNTLIKSLSDTMLAAVGAVIGSFIAALFADKFNAVIFQIGLWIYAGYVLAFPCIINMKNQWSQYQAYIHDFDSRRKRFEVRLYTDRVKEIIGDQFTDGKTRFEGAFRNIVYTYVLIIFIAIALSFILPPFVQRSITALQSTVTPTVSATLPYTPTFQNTSMPVSIPTITPPISATVTPTP